MTKRTLVLALLLVLSGAAAWQFSGPEMGEVKLGHTMHECNGPGRTELKADGMFWATTRWQDPRPKSVYEVRISRHVDGDIEQVTAWSVNQKSDNQDTIYFGGKRVDKVCRGHTGKMRYSIHADGETLAKVDFMVREAGQPIAPIEAE